MQLAQPLLLRLPQASTGGAQGDFPPSQVGGLSSQINITANQWMVGDNWVVA